MTLEGLAADVDVQQVHALLLARTAPLPEEGSEERPLYEATVRQVTAEVVAVTGGEPQDAYRGLALAAIALGVAAQLEFALFPEQQGLGTDGRGAALQRRYEALLVRLGTSAAAAGSIPTIAHPTGDFPALCPDPLGYFPGYL